MEKLSLLLILFALFFGGCKSSELTILSEISDSDIPARETSAVDNKPTVNRKNITVYEDVSELYEAGAAEIFYRGYQSSGYIKGIDGNYSKFPIKNEADALLSLIQIKKLTGISDPESELVHRRTAVNKFGLVDETVYDFSQYYKGVPVWGGSVRVIVDNKTGYPYWFAGSFVPDIKLETVKPEKSKEQMYRLVKKMKVKKVFDDMELCVFCGDNGGSTPALAYTVTVTAMAPVWNDPSREIPLEFQYILNADTGEIIRKNQLTIVD